MQRLRKRRGLVLLLAALALMSCTEVETQREVCTRWKVERRVRWMTEARVPTTETEKIKQCEEWRTLR